jgi:hypothetical protein
MSISDSEEAPSHVYAAELDGRSVIVKHYKKKKGGLQERVMKVDDPTNYWQFTDYFMAGLGAHRQGSCSDIVC